MIPIELAHYDVWAKRLEAELQAVYPRTFWMVLKHAEHQVGDPWRVELPWDDGPLPRFRLIALKLGSGRHISEDVPFTVVVDEGMFPFVVLSLGEVMEQRLAAMVGEG